MLHSAAGAGKGAARDILGVRVSDFARAEALEFVHARIAGKTFTPITFLNAHNANVAASDDRFRDVLSRFSVLSDGIGVDIAAKVLYGAPFRANLNGTDLVPDILMSAPSPIKVGLFGARPGVADKAAAVFSAIDARHEYRVISHGFPTVSDEKRAIGELTAWKPDILLVALGVPKQELWIADNLTPDHCTVPIGVGALFDLVTDTVPRAPIWVRAARCEWVYRLLREPRRLARRYVLGNPLFIARVCRMRVSRGVRYVQT